MTALKWLVVHINEKGKCGLRANGFHYDSSKLQQHPAASFQCEDWTVTQVLKWLKGIDESSNSSAYARAFKKARDVSRSKILQAIGLLSYYSYTTKYENLQKLAADTIAGVSNLLNAVAFATPVINSSAHSSKILEALNTVLRSVTELHECVLKLIFWLDRSPFDDKKSFISTRQKVSALIEEMVDCVNNPNNPKFFSVPQVLVERGSSIRKTCEDIIAMNDPLILYTAFMERVTIRKTSATNWGFDVDSTCTGLT
uniref:CRIC domain-containing protein n=1 Tax=Ditylenchus dipsaci TaxID=166011 RepID=A0A915D5P4_9BILA